MHVHHDGAPVALVRGVAALVLTALGACTANIPAAVVDVRPRLVDAERILLTGRHTEATVLGPGDDLPPASLWVAERERPGNGIRWARGFTPSALEFAARPAGEGFETFEAEALDGDLLVLGSLRVRFPRLAPDGTPTPEAIEAECDAGQTCSERWVTLIRFGPGGEPRWARALRTPGRDLNASMRLGPASIVVHAVHHGAAFDVSFSADGEFLGSLPAAGRPTRTGRARLMDCSLESVVWETTDSRFEMNVASLFTSMNVERLRGCTLVDAEAGFLLSVIAGRPGLEGDFVWLAQVDGQEGVQQTIAAELDGIRSGYRGPFTVEDALVYHTSTVDGVSAWLRVAVGLSEAQGWRVDADRLGVRRHTGGAIATENGTWLTLDDRVLGVTAEGDCADLTPATVSVTATERPPVASRPREPVDASGPTPRILMLTLEEVVELAVYEPPSSCGAE